MVQDLRSVKEPSELGKRIWGKIVELGADKRLVYSQQLCVGQERRRTGKKYISLVDSFPWQLMVKRRDSEKRGTLIPIAAFLLTRCDGG